MALLTPDQTDWLRDTIGDDCPDYDLSATVLQYEYDRAGNDADLTVVYLLRRLLGKFAKKIDTTSVEGIGSSASQRFTHTQDLLREWERLTGLTGTRMTFGVIDLNLDMTDEDYA